MKRYFLVLLFCCCSGEDLLVKGEQIASTWNGKYQDSSSGQELFNVGDKELDIMNIDGFDNGFYYVDTIIQQETELQVWISNTDSQYVPLQMTRENIDDIATTISLNNPMSQKASFPTSFYTNISTIRF